MKGKKILKINRYNGAVFLVILIIIFTLVTHVIQLKKQEDKFLELYQNDLQVKSELLATSINYWMQSNDVKDGDWDKLLEYTRGEDTIDESTWAYIAYDGVVLYYKNQNLIETNNTISLEKFLIQLNKNSSLLIARSSFSYNDKTITVGLTTGKNMVLMDSGYSNFKMVLLLEGIVAILLLSLIGIYFIWESRKESKEVARRKKEVVNMNFKLEELNQELNRISFEKENDELHQLKQQAYQYDMELVKLLLTKTNDGAYLPVSIIYVQFDMGNLYFTKKRMSEIEKQLRIQLDHKYELFEIGKGEFIFIMIRTDIEDIMHSIDMVEERAEDVANVNGIEVIVKSRTITNVVEDPLNELEKIRTKRG